MKDKKDLLARLRRIEGQIRGIHKMIEEERECTDVITQVIAATSAMDKVGFLIVSESLKKCAAKHGANDDEAFRSTDDAIKLLISMARHGK